MKILNRLYYTDYISISALLFAWAGILFLLIGKAEIAIYLSLLSFIFDLLDGFVARKTNVFSDIGARLDTHVDVFLYLIFSCILFLFYIGKLDWHNITVTFIVLVFGILRLIRFVENGIIINKRKEYYVGLPVYFPYFIIIYTYLIDKAFNINYHFFTEIILLVTSFLMISEIKHRKTRNPIILGALILSITILNIYVHNK